jgi:hypothetical protein
MKKKSPLSSGLFSSFLLALFFLFKPDLASAIENLRFHDWQADVLSLKDSKKQCYIQFSAISRRHMLVSMRLAILEERIPTKVPVTWTLIKVSASWMRKGDPSDLTAIKIEEAWLETSEGASLGKIKQVDQGEVPHFLGGTRGSSLFDILLKGIGKDGVTIGFRTKSEAKVIVLHVPPPTNLIFLKLYDC